MGIIEIAAIVMIVLSIWLLIFCFVIHLKKWNLHGQTLFLASMCGLICLIASCLVLLIPTKENTNYGYDIEPKNCILEKIDSIDEIEDDEYFLYIGRETCPWCQTYVPYYNNILKRYGIETIYYFDIQNINKATINYEHSTPTLEYSEEKYEKMIDKIVEMNGAEYLGIYTSEETNNCLLWQYVPILYKIENNQITFAFDILENHPVDKENGIMPITQEQENEIKNLFKEELGL